MLDNYILKEAHKKILIILIIGFFLDIFISSCLAKIAYSITIFLVFVYRNSNKSFSKTNNIVSPIDGEITAIDIKDGKSIIHIDVSIFNKHILRAPCEGKVEILEIKHGLNFNTNTMLSKKLNNIIKFKIDKNIITLIDGNLNVGTSIDTSNNEYEQSDKVGVFTNGKLILELNTKHTENLKLSQKVYAGKTILT